MKPTTAIVIVGLLLVIAAGLWFVYDKGIKDAELARQTLISSFEECAAAGNPIMESYPRQCATKDGRSFTEEVVVPPAPSASLTPTYTNASANLIVIDAPAPGAVADSTVVVRGKARGTWYFEASFPVEIQGKDGKVLVQAPAQAQGEWMTEEFVPFEVTLSVPQGYSGPATLVLRKDNPSGLPEHDASVSIPLVIE